MSLSSAFVRGRVLKNFACFFLSLCFGRLGFSNAVDDLKKAQGLEEVRQLVFVGCTCETIEIVCRIPQANRKEKPNSLKAPLHVGEEDADAEINRGKTSMSTTY